MLKKYRVGVAGMVHDHVWGDLEHWRAQPNVEIVAAGDTNLELRERAARDFGIPNVYNSWEEMLQHEQLDIVHAATENSVCAEVVEACAARGIHVVSEKPMAATLAQAERMLTAATEAKTLLMINWPTAWIPTFREWHRQLMSGAIGNVTHIKYRSAHNGPKEIGCSPYFWGWLYDSEKNGAGALMDYCCYAANISASILGLPSQVMGMRGTFVKDYPVPDDNAIIVMKYPHAFAVAEASWTQVSGYAEGNNPVAYGTGGSLAVCGENVVLHRSGKDIEMISPPQPGHPHGNLAEYFLHCLASGAQPEGLCSPLVSRNAQEILQAGLISADTGQTMTLPLLPPK